MLFITKTMLKSSMPLFNENFQDRLSYILIFVNYMLSLYLILN
jgi:hypothetical protein